MELPQTVVETGVTLTLPARLSVKVLTAHRSPLHDGDDVLAAADPPAPTTGAATKTPAMVSATARYRPRLTLRVT